MCAFHSPLSPRRIPKSSPVLSYSFYHFWLCVLRTMEFSVRNAGDVNSRYKSELRRIMYSSLFFWISHTTRPYVHLVACVLIPVDFWKESFW
jgi:hypothetical protein